MHHYAQHGARQFILATGYQSEHFPQSLIDTFNASPDKNDAELYHFSLFGITRQVRLVATAENATTASRLIACKPWLENAPIFALSYSDSLSNADLCAEMAFHQSHKLNATLLQAKLPVRFRILGIRHGESKVRAFASRPVIEASPINGGYYIFNNAIWNKKYALYDCSALENEPLEKLAAEGHLAAFSDKSEWHCLDAERDCCALEKIAQQHEDSARR